VKVLSVIVVPILFACSVSSQTQNCTIHFSVVWKDQLNNIKQGLSPNDTKWFQKKIAKKYPGICYDSGAAPVVFFVSTKLSTYQGTQVVTSAHSNPVDGTITDPNGNMSTVRGTEDTRTQTAVPYSVGYEDMILSLEVKQPDGTWKVRHNFTHNTLGNAYYGIKVSNRHPTQELVEQAIKWIYDGGLTDPRQSMMPSR
jgi:hypothetical protein